MRKAISVALPVFLLMLPSAASAQNPTFRPRTVQEKGTQGIADNAIKDAIELLKLRRKDARTQYDVGRLNNAIATLEKLIGVAKTLPDLKVRATLEGAGNDVVFVTFTPDGKQLVSIDNSSTWRLWDAITGQEKNSFSGPYSVDRGRIQSLSCNPDGTMLGLIMAGRTYLMRWKIVEKKDSNPKVTLTENYSWNLLLPNHFLTLSPDGKVFASVSHVPRQGTVKLWDVKTAQERAILNSSNLETNPGKQPSIAFSRDGTMLALASRDQTLKVYDVETGKLKTTLKEGNGSVAFLTFSPDGNFLAVGINGTIKLWDLKAGQVSVYLAEGAEDAVFGPDGTLLVSRSGLGLNVIRRGGKNMKLWDVKTGQLMGEFMANPWPVRISVAFSPDGTFLAAGADKLIKLWDIPVRK